MLSQEKFYKLSKYAIRLNKSFINNKRDDYIKYCNHLKYHIGGGSDLDNMFAQLTALIGKKTEYQFAPLIEEKSRLEEQNKTITAEKTEVTNKLETANTEINTLKNDNASLAEKKIELTEKINRYNDIIKTINEKLQLEITDNDYTKLTEYLDNITTKLKDNKTLLETNKVTLEENESRINALTARVSELEKQLADVTAEKVALDKQIEELQETQPKQV